MQINPSHHMSILQRQDRILTGNFDMCVLEYQQVHDSHTLVQTNGVDIAINYPVFFAPLNQPLVLAASAGANVHALAHNLRTPRMEYHMLDAFKNNGPLWRQAFNIAEDWRVECHVVDDSYVSGPLLAALFNHSRLVTKPSVRELFVLASGRIYLSNPDLVGGKHAQYVRALRDLAAHEHPQTVINEWREFDSIDATDPVSGALRDMIEQHEDLYGLTGTAWANALIEHAIMYHDKLWSMRHLNHPVNEIYLLGSQMCQIIDRITVLIGPCLQRANGTAPAFDIWQDITFQFDQTGQSLGSGDGEQGNGQPQSSSGNPSDGDGKSDGDGDGDDKQKGQSKSERSDKFANDVFNDCRCGTCGR